MAGDEAHPLPFALDDQPHGHALHPAGREPRTNLPPQQRRHVVAVEPVDDPPHLLGPHQVGVDLARLLQGLADRLFGDFVKHQAMDRHLRLQHLAEMPTDGLPLAVFVRRQIQVLGVLEHVLEFADLRDLVAGNHVDGIEILVDVHAQVGPVFPLEFGRDFLRPWGRSRIWPMLASIVYPRPRNLPMVRALAGDSTMTSEVPPERAVFFAIRELLNWGISSGLVTIAPRLVAPLPSGFLGGLLQGGQGATRIVPDRPLGTIVILPVLMDTALVPPSAPAV